MQQDDADGYNDLNGNARAQVSDEEVASGECTCQNK